MRGGKVSTNKPIPFLDLVTPHVELMDELCATVRTALETAGFIGGPMVQGFETDYAKYCDTQHAIGVANGTDALRFAIMAAGIAPGDIAITVPNTFIATTEAISQAGAHPVFVDIDESTYNMDPAKLQEYIEMECDVDSHTGHLIERKTRRRVTAVVPVHLYGQMVDMDAILEIASRYNLTVIEDACQAHGAEYFSKKENRWRKAGSMGAAAAFSFYPGKNLGACGEAGAVTTNDADIAKTVRMLRDHGQSQKYYHEIEGYNGRLDAIQAGFLKIKLKHLPEWTEKRRAAAARYQEMFEDCDESVKLPFEPAWSKAVYHLFVVRVPNREELMKHMAAEQIGTGIHYPIPLHLQNAYKFLGHKRGDFPIAERVSAEILSLPMFPQLEAEQQKRVVREVMSFVTAEKVC
jgi:dTDP-4-amino-4,6-dideoxygalactose transaminase